MEANAVAAALLKAKRVYPADAGSDRRDRPARTLALPVCRTSVEGIVFARIRVNMVPRALSMTFANGLAPMRIWIRIQNGSFGLHPKGDDAKDENPKVSISCNGFGHGFDGRLFLRGADTSPTVQRQCVAPKPNLWSCSDREHGRR